MSEVETLPDETVPAPKWKPLPSLERRILGVLGEKAKTTPDSYPLSLNALINGCNQKSNRYPQMKVEPIQAENALEKLRAISAVSEVQGGGRVARFKHYIYEWLGVSKLESAVMIELLLRGSQTIGELRGRAARMEPIDDVAALKPIVGQLIERGLVISLTPEGRGQIVTHALYLEEEMEKVRRKAAEAADAMSTTPDRPPAPASPVVRTTSDASSSSSPGEDSALQREVQELRAEVAKLRSEIEDIWKNIG
jgi:uncharacterized protein YceH (UPF0502 family)